MSKNPLSSRKFVIAIISLVMFGLTTFAPPDVSARVEKYAPFVTGIVVAALFGITLEDSVKLWAGRPGTIRDALQEVLDETFPQPEPPATNVTVNVPPPSSEALPSANNPMVLKG